MRVTNCAGPIARRWDTMSEVAKAWAELDETVAMAEAIGFSREEVERIVGRMRRETSWDMTRIRKEIIALYGETPEKRIVRMIGEYHL